MAATALFWGIASRRGGGRFCRNLGLTIGLPRGAKDGLDVVEDNSASWFGVPSGSSPPSPASQISDGAQTCPV